MKMPTDSLANLAELKRYLYSEMTEDERIGMEEKLFLDDELFFEAANLENELVDQYVRGRLTGGELERFERSLTLLPERRQKVANATALQEFIDDKRHAESDGPASAADRTFWQKLTDLFTINTTAFGYGMAGLLVVFALLSVFLIMDNRRKANDIAQLQSGQESLEQMETELAGLRQRESELQIQIDSERETSGDLTEELQREKTRREQIEAQLARLRKEREQIQQRPMIATIFLPPTVGGRGGDSSEMKDLAVAPGTKRIAMQLGLPDSVKAGERLSVNLNTRPIAQNLAARSAAEGRKTIHITVSPDYLQEGPNRLGVVNADGNEVSKYIFNFIWKSK